MCAPDQSYNDFLNNFWELESELSFIARSLNTSPELLRQNANDYELSTRIRIADILWDQIYWLEKARTERIRNMISKDVVNLTDYRRLVV